MGVVLQRNLGPVSHLAPRQYTTETRDETPAICCPACGGISDLDLEVFGDGTVELRWPCPETGCSFVDFLFLEAWREPVVPLPRAKDSP